MANRIPLIVNQDDALIEELPIGDNLDIGGGEIVNVSGISTTNFTATGNINLGNAEDIFISGGFSGDFLQTDGNGNLIWSVVAPYTTNIISGDGNGSFQSVLVGTGLNYDANTQSLTSTTVPPSAQTILAGNGTGGIVSVSIGSGLDYNNSTQVLSAVSTTPAVEAILAGDGTGSITYISIGDGLDYNANTQVLSSTISPPLAETLLAGDGTGGITYASVGSGLNYNANTQILSSTTVPPSVEALLVGNGSGGIEYAIIGAGLDYNSNTQVLSSTLNPPPATTSLLKGDGSDGFAVAIAGTDFAPATFGSAILYGNGSGGFSSVTIGTGLTFAGGNLTVSSAQPNITSVGTLENITISGNIVVNSDDDPTAIVNGGTSGVGNIGSPTNYFNTVYATTTSSQHADLAEMYLADARYDPGTVLIFGGIKEVTIGATSRETSVVGVVSTSPAHIMNSSVAGEFPTIVALLGRVPCLVEGPVKAGDLMVSAGNGRAKSDGRPRIGSVIGKAIQNFDGDIGTIEILVGRH